MTLAEKVRDRRIALGLSQHQLAIKMGYASRGSINKIEAGRPVTQKIIVKLADALDVTPAYLMGWNTDENETAIDYIKNLNLSKDEINEIIDYVNFLVSKRK